MKLRDYQREAIDNTYQFWREHEGNPVIVLPTGTGKTIVFASLIKELDEEMPGLRVLIMAHSAELLEQAEDKLRSVYPEVDTGIYCAALKRKELDHNITIASRDSIINALDELGKIDLIIIDEAHRISNKDEGRYREILQKLEETNGQIGVIGFTATDYRKQKSDGNPYIHGENRIFSGVSFQRNIKWFIDNGYLCRPAAPRTGVEIDTTGIRDVGGDYNQGQLASAAEAEVEACCDDMMKYAGITGRQSIVVFCASVLHAEMVVADMDARGVSSDLVHGKLKRNHREEILYDFEQGDIRVLANVGVLTEGWDCPRVDCIAIMRPTKSLGLFMQMIGRGTRTFPGKDYFLLLDYGGCIDRFGPIDVARPTERKPETRTKDCPRCKEINSFYARKCSNCAFQFEANPMKECGYCETPNPPSATQCVACGGVFPRNLTQTSSDKKLFSTERDLKWMEVESIRMEVASSKKTGRDYVRVAFYCGPFNQFSTVMCLGYPGYAGEKAKRLSAQFTKQNYTGYDDPEEFVQMWKDLPRDDRRIPREIQIDFNSKYNDVTGYKFP